MLGGCTDVEHHFEVTNNLRHLFSLSYPDTTSSLPCVLLSFWSDALNTVALVTIHYALFLLGVSFLS